MLMGALVVGITETHPDEAQVDTGALGFFRGSHGLHHNSWIARPTGQTSNSVLEALQEWSHYLSAPSGSYTRNCDDGLPELR